MEKLNSSNERGDDEATISSNDYTEDELEALNAMNEYSEFHDQENYEYVVRGALLYCDCGSHHRRLNLPVCHGVYRGQHPLMRSDDCKAGLEGASIHLTSFGICNGFGSDNIGQGNISLEPEVLGEDGLPIQGEADGSVIKGNRCMASIPSGTWENVHYETQITDEGKFALTTNSFLKCKHGGIIRVVTSGQETVMTEKDYVNDDDLENKVWEENDELLEDINELDSVESVETKEEELANDERYMNLVNTVNTINLEQYKKDFVLEIFPILYEYEKNSNVPLEIMFAQMCIESSYGADDLVDLANNYFGIKGVGPLGSVDINTGEHFDGGYATNPAYSDLMLDVLKYWRLYE